MQGQRLARDNMEHREGHWCQRGSMKISNGSSGEESQIENWRISGSLLMKQGASPRQRYSKYKDLGMGSSPTHSRNCKYFIVFSKLCVCVCVCVFVCNSQWSVRLSGHWNELVFLCWFQMLLWGPVRSDVQMTEWSSQCYVPCEIRELWECTRTLLGLKSLKCEGLYYVF